MTYLDYQATTPLAPEAREAMLQELGTAESSSFANPHSPHRMGRGAKAVIEAARDNIAALLPSGGRIIFTGNACEAINLAMRGAPTQGRIAVSAIEHAAVMDTAHALGRRHIMPVDTDGLCDPAQSIPEDIGMIAVMQVNNEIGVVQPNLEWLKTARARGAILLTDAVQSYGKIAVETADLIAITAHKLYGPKGIGALWVRDGIELHPQITGGLQEGARSGTLSPALAAGFGAAAKLAGQRMEEDDAHMEALWNRARELFSDWTINGSIEARWKGNLNIRQEELDVARLMSDCRNVMFSAGSACASGSGQTSHVLKAIGLTDAQAKSSIRLGFGRYTTMDDLETAAAAINAAVKAQE